MKILMLLLALVVIIFAYACFAIWAVVQKAWKPVEEEKQDLNEIINEINTTIFNNY